MYCHNCGHEVDDHAKYCQNCGAPLQPQQNDQGFDQNQNYYNQPYRPVEEDAPSVGFAILSFLVPIIGLVLFLVWNKEYPLKAKSCLKGFIANCVLELLLVCCLSASGAGMISGGYDEYYDFYDFTVVEIVENVE